MRKTGKHGGSQAQAASSNDRISDPRFANIQKDPRFRLPSKSKTHVQVDKRFAHMLRDDRFSSKAKVDRYGRKLPSGTGRKELERYYRLEDEEPDSDGDVQRELQRVNRSDGTHKGVALDIGEEEEEEEEDDPSSSSDDETTESEGEDEDEEVFGILQQSGEGAVGSDGVPIGQVSSRLAVVNLDWDNIRAVDLMAVFSSFVPNNGQIIKVSVYPSEFGKERMEKEEIEGPPKEIFAQRPRYDAPQLSKKAEDTSSSEESDDDDEEGSELDEETIKKSMLKEDSGIDFNSAKLRRYQLERLRYFYAVLSCSSISVAQAIYDAVDGTEYLTTANFFDLRYIPDDTDFSDDKPRDECQRIPTGYRPNEFVTDALQHSKVKLTWDADDGERKEIQKRAFSGSRKDIEENDLKAYLGSDTSDEEADTHEPQVIVVDATNPNNGEQQLKKVEEPKQTISKKEAERQRMRSLLGLAAEPESRKSSKDKDRPVGDMQITFMSGFSNNPSKGSVFENEPDHNETTVEKYVRKERERKARRREQAKSKRTENDEGSGDDESEDHDIDMKDRNRSDEGETEERDQVDGNDVDKGFDDEFFNSNNPKSKPSSSNRSSSKQPPPPKNAPIQPTRKSSPSPPPSLEPRLPSPSPSLSETHHFSIPLLQRASHTLTKNKKRKHLTARDKASLAAKEKDTFEMNVGDSRFADVFERPEFAIDPSHPRFQGTEGMRELLREGRKRRRGADGEDGDGGGDADGDGRRREREREKGSEKKREADSNDNGDAPAVVRDRKGERDTKRAKRSKGSYPDRKSISGSKKVKKR